MNIIAFMIVFSVAPFLAVSQVNWELKKDKEGIKVYTKSTAHSDVKAVKVVCTLQAKLSQLAALLLDTKAHEQWVYNTKTSFLVKQISPHQQVYYSEIDLPWPLANREVVVNMKIVQHPVTRVMQVDIVNADDKVPAQKGTVRVPASSVNWKVTPIDKNRLSVEYEGLADPGGSVPSWVVNAFSTKGPFETFKKLRELVMSPIYANARYDFIKE